LELLLLFFSWFIEIVAIEDLIEGQKKFLCIGYSFEVVGTRSKDFEFRTTWTMIKPGGSLMVIFRAL
jgi:hypothetical protein